MNFSWLRNLTQPHDDITNPVHRRRARALAFLTLSFGITMAITTTLTQTWDSLPIVGVFAMFVIAYALSRTPYSQYGAVFIVLGTTVIFSSIFLLLGDDATVISTVLLIVLIPVLLSVLLLGTRWTLGISLLIGLSLIAIVPLSAFTFADILTPLALYALVAVLVVVIAYVQNQDIQLIEQGAVEREQLLEQNRAILEQIAEARSFELETVVEVNQQIATILNVDRLLQDVVDLTKERFGFYHVHIYLLDEASNTLSIEAGAGHVGRQLASEAPKLALGNRDSIVSNAARQRRPQVINDTQASKLFSPNPALPDTRSEMALPLIARGRLLGVLDVQHDEEDYFSDEILKVLRVLANQIAVAYSNARLFQETDRQRRHEEALSKIDRQIQGALGMEEVLETAVRELGKALRVPHTGIELHLQRPDSNGTTE